MTTEEKAKAYDEAIEKINSKWHYKNKPCFIDVAEIFPELKDSEDDRIRKELVDYLKDFIPHTDLDLVRKSKVWIEWLEKKAKEMANKYPEVGYNSKYHREIYSAAMEMAEWLLSHQWVRVEDELPPKKEGWDCSEKVIVRTKSDCIESSTYSYRHNMWVNELSFDRITHWMPIPPLAEEGGEK